MRSTDALLARYAGEIDDRQKFLDGLVETAQTENRDLTSQEMELVTKTQERMSALGSQLEPLKEARRIADDSASKLSEVASLMRTAAAPPSEVQYRSAGYYAVDMWRAGLGQMEARERLDVFNRAAAHQTTGDNPGLLPEQILGPVVSFVDTNRPVVTVFGPRQLPGGSWSRPTVTQHTRVGPQSAEKTELISQKMTINKVPVAPKTFGGYVNVSRQDVDWTQPAIMDIVINDLAAQYAKETEHQVITDMAAAATAGPTIPTGTPTPEALAAAFWAAAGTVYNATLGAGRLISICGTDVLGVLGPAFPPINPTNAQSAGFAASGFGTGPAGSIAGIPLYVTAGAPANKILVTTTACVEIYEDRVGALQVVEPSVLGVQVAYAGYFADLMLQPLGIVAITKTP